MGRTERTGLTVDDLMMQTGLHWLGIGSRLYDNEYLFKLETNQK